MSIYNENKPSSNPFKTITIEYYEEFDSNDRLPAEVQTPVSELAHQIASLGRRRIRVVTTTRKYNLGSVKGDPIVSVTYEYL
jgi:hypothetical protein